MDSFPTFELVHCSMSSSVASWPTYHFLILYPSIKKYISKLVYIFYFSFFLLTNLLYIPQECYSKQCFPKIWPWNSFFMKHPNKWILGKTHLENSAIIHRRKIICGFLISIHYLKQFFFCTKMKRSFCSLFNQVSL